MSQLRNLRHLYDLLVDRGAEGISVADAAKTLGISVPSVYRYEEYLEVLFGGKVTERHSGVLYLLDDAAFLASLGKDELQALTVARKLLAQIGMPFANEFAKLSAKLERGSKDGFESLKRKATDYRRMQSQADQRLAFVEPHLCRDPGSDDRITALYRWSLEEPRPMIGFAYHSLTTVAQPKRRVYPLGLVFKNAWFLVGYDPTREPRVRVYAVDRMDEPRRLDLPPPLVGFPFDVSEHFASAWRLIGGGEAPQRVVFRLRKKASEEKKHASWQVEEEGAEWQTISVQVARPEEMIPFLLSKGGDLEVLEPPPLRNTIQKNMEKAIASYRHP